MFALTTVRSVVAQAPEPAGRRTAPEAPLAAEENTNAPVVATPTSRTASVEPANAGYSPSHHFFIQSDDGNYRVSIQLETSFKIEPVLFDGHMQNRSIFYVLRPALAGNVFRKTIRYRLALELAHDPIYLLDSWIEYAPCDAFSFRFGQQPTPISRHEGYFPSEILFPDRAIVAEYFWTGRDKGLTVEGAPFDRKLEYYAGIYSGSPLRRSTVINGNYVAVARVTVSPMSPAPATEYPFALSSPAETPFGISFTLQGYVSRVQTGLENFNPGTFKLDTQPTGVVNRQQAAGADVMLYGGPFVLLAEGYIRRTDPGVDSTGIDNPAYASIGAWGETGLDLYRKLISAALRFDWLNPSISLANDRLIAAEAQVAYYVDAPRLVLRARYGFAHQQMPDPYQQQGVSLYLPSGTYDVFTLQASLGL